MNVLNQGKAKSKKIPVPGIVYILWTSLILVFLFIAIPIANIGHTGGEQIPLTLFVYSIIPSIWGYFIISLITSIIYPSWFKKYWIINLIVFLSSGYFLLHHYFIQ